MKINLPYGRAFITAEVPGANVTILEPRFVEGLPDERSAFSGAVRSPINFPALRGIIGSHDKIAVLIPDITRPFPSQRILPWLFAELSHVSAGNFTIIIGTGSHRANTPAELNEMLGDEIVARYRIVDHNAHDRNTMAPVAVLPEGPLAIPYLDRH